MRRTHTTTSPSPQRTMASFRFSAANFPGRVLRHRGFEAWYDEEDGSELMLLDSSFVPVAGPDGSWRFESVNFPNHFLRHSGFELFLHNAAKTADSNGARELFRMDSSFNLVDSINGDANLQSFQSVNFPDRYLRHSGFRLRLDKPDHIVDDFSFGMKMSPAPVEGVAMAAVTLNAANFRGHYLRHRRFEAWYDKKPEGDELFLKDSSFTPVAGPDGSWRFESVNYPNHFLRHSGFKLFLHNECTANDKALFMKDSSFTMVPSLNKNTTLMSFQSVNYPDRYLRHSGFRLRLDPPDHIVDDFSFGMKMSPFVSAQLKSANFSTPQIKRKQIEPSSRGALITDHRMAEEEFGVEVETAGGRWESLRRRVDPAVLEYADANGLFLAFASKPQLELTSKKSRNT